MSSKSRRSALITRSSFCSESSRQYLSQTVRDGELNFLGNVHPPCVTCHMSSIIFSFYKVVDLVGGGSVINGAYPVQLQNSPGYTGSVKKLLMLSRTTLSKCRQVLLREENPAYGRHRIFRPMLKEAPTQKKQRGWAAVHSTVEPLFYIFIH